MEEAGLIIHKINLTKYLEYLNTSVEDHFISHCTIYMFYNNGSVYHVSCEVLLIVMKLQRMISNSNLSGPRTIFKGK